MDSVHSTYEIKLAQDDRDYKMGAELFREYAKSINIDLGFQKFEEELNKIHLQYGPPNGGLLLIKHTDGSYMGCVAIRKIDETAAELKRMFIKPEAQGKGLGRLLLNRALDLARLLHYEKVLLDTMPFMESAIQLYKKMGFYEVEPYRYNPFEDALFFEKML